MNKRHNHVSIDYYAYCSALRDWNSNFKVLFGVFALISVIGFNTILVSISTLIFMLILTVVIGGIKWDDYFRLLLLPCTFILMSGIAIAVSFTKVSDSIVTVKLFHMHLSVTREGVVLAIHTGLKAIGAVSALYMITLSTPMGEIIAVFRKMKVPVLILELMHLIYRYIFILSDINKKQKDAARSRLGYVDLRTSFRTFGSEMANLLITSFKKADLYYDAMEARGYEGDCLFWEERKGVTLFQFGVALLYGGMVLMLVILRRNYG